MQSIEERKADLERAADAVRYALDPDPAIPARLKPVAAAYVAGLIRSSEPAFREWETRAQNVSTQATAVSVLEEAGAPTELMRVVRARLDEERQALAEVALPDTLGEPRAVLDLLAELTDRSHPLPPR